MLLPWPLDLNPYEVGEVEAREYQQPTEIDSHKALQICPDMLIVFMRDNLCY
jgi:hypothetical protein